MGNHVSFALDKDTTLTSVLVVGAALGIHAIFKLFNAPSVESIQKMCTKSMPELGENDSITVWGFDVLDSCLGWKHGISDSSPYVSRVEAYLRLVNQPYTKLESKGAMENPRGKVPFANIKGTMVDDSSSIIALLKNMFGDTVDCSLSEEQHVQGYLIQQLLQGSLYWVLLHQKFNTEFGRKTFSDEMKEKFPPVISTLISKHVFRNMHKNLYGAGIGRMSHVNICKKGEEDVAALSKLLGKEKFILGTKSPTSYDCDVYSWLVLLFHDEAQEAVPWVCQLKSKDSSCSNLLDYVSRMRDILYPELKK